jgi:hypothetical protein
MPHYLPVHETRRILNMTVVASSVAIVIPDTGFEEEPTIPTILEETVAKKKEKITVRIAPIIPMLGSN